MQVVLGVFAGGWVYCLVGLLGWFCFAGFPVDCCCVNSVDLVCRCSCDWLCGIMLGGLFNCIWLTLWQVCNA